MIKKAKFLLKEATLRVKYMTSKDCIFCKMITGEMIVQKVFENEEVLAINDINPVAKVHILIMPKKHLQSVLTIKDEDANSLVELFKAAQKIVRDKRIESFRLAFNAGKFQHVSHMHMHLLAGGKVEWAKL